MGRPSEYKPEYADKLIEHMREGDSFETFGAIVGKSRRTLYNWIDTHEDFKEAKEVGEVLSEHWWWKKGKEYMVTFDKETRFNVAVWIFTMKCRFGHRDGSEGRVKEPDKPTNEQTESLIEEMRNIISMKERRGA
jgi:hypothetical protein